MEPIKLAEKLGKAILTSAAHTRITCSEKKFWQMMLPVACAYQKKQWHFAANRKKNR